MVITHFRKIYFKLTYLHLTGRTPIITIKEAGPNFLSWCGEIWSVLW